jgi:DNA-binding MarR family transcriptional regulator
MVDRLIAAGLVDRRENAQDRREVVIDLTPAGRSLVRRVTRKRRGEIERIVVAMPVGRRRELIRALVAFAGAADEPAVVAETASRLGW